MAWPGTGKAVQRRRELKDKARFASSVYESSRQEVDALKAAIQAAKKAGDQHTYLKLSRDLQVAEMAQSELLLTALEASLRSKRR